MDELFYDPAGLQQAALLVEAEFKRGIDQKTLAQKAGVAASTIGALRLNIHNSGDRIVRWINPTILLKLGPYITNPETQQPFKAEEFLEIARGRRKVSLEGNSTSNRVADQSGSYNAVPYPLAVEMIRKGMGDRSLQEFAARVEIEPERLKEILTASDPQRALPKFDELLRLAGEVAPGHEVEPLMALYGFGKVSNGKGLKSAQN